MFRVTSAATLAPAALVAALVITGSAAPTPARDVGGASTREMGGASTREIGEASTREAGEASTREAGEASTGEAFLASLREADVASAREADPASTREVRQASVTGRVVDGQSGRPLADAHVFIAASMIGGITASDGRFRLRNVPAGAHTIYVSMLGYAPARLDTLLRAGDHVVVDFALEPAVVEGPEVIVTAERDPAWYRRLRKFTRQFIGESPTAEQCTIENPEVLSFETRWWGKLTARAREPLVIMNPALGYRVTYFLEEFESAGGTIKFDGEPLFEPLSAADSAAAARWQSARESAYKGSFRHFMKSLLEGTYRDEGFRVHMRYDLDRGLVYGDRFGFDRNRVLDITPDADEAVLDFRGYIEVTYEPERVDPAYLRWQYGTSWNQHDVQRSLIELTDGPTRVDMNGEVADPYGVTVYGYFAYERIGDLVPKEYRP